jgi:hypothetical protein
MYAGYDGNADKQVPRNYNLHIHFCSRMKTRVLAAAGQKPVIMLHLLGIT